MALFVLFSLQCCTALKQNHTFRVGRHPSYQLERFSFLPGGTVRAKIVHAIPSELLKSTTLGVLAVVSPDGRPLLNYTGNSCPLNPYVLPRMTKNAEHTKFKAFTFTYKAGELFYEVPRDHRGVWSFHFIICGPVPSGHSVTVGLQLDNIDMNGRNSYLSADKMTLPYIFLWAGLAHLALLVVWVWTLWNSPSREIFALHWLMLMLLILKIFSIFCESFMYFSMASSGAPNGWKVAFYFFQAARSLFIFFIVLLIGSGWRLMRSHIVPQDRYLFWIVLPLQLIANIGIAASDELTLNQHWFYFFQILDILCCILVLSPALEPAERPQKRSQMIDRLRYFYVLLICYIYATRVLTQILPLLLPANSAWVSNLTSELATILFFFFAGREFRPSRDNPLFAAVDESKEI